MTTGPLGDGPVRLTAPGSHRLIWLGLTLRPPWILGFVPANPGWPRPRHNTLLLLRARLPTPYLTSYVGGG